MKYFLPPPTRSTQTTYQPNPLRRPPEPAPPMPYPETVGQALSPANPSNSHRNRRPNRTCLAGFFGIIHNNSFVFNKTIRKGRTNVSGFWPPPAPSPSDPPPPRRSPPDPTPAGSAPPEDTPRPAPAPRPASPRLPESRSPPSACKAPAPCPPSPP